MLPCIGVLVVGVTSLQEREQVPSLLRDGDACMCWCLSDECVCIVDLPERWPLPPLLYPVRRGLRLHFCGKVVKTGKMKDKDKKVASGVAVLLIRWEQFPYSMESCGALIIWPLHSLVWRVVAMPWPVRPCAMKVGGTCARIFIERELGGTIVVTPVAVEVWMSSW
jgi:hypothetical protein